MNKLKYQRQEQALNNLLNIREDNNLPQGYKSIENNRENNVQNYEDHSRKIFRKKKNQKQNQNSKKIILPRLYNSKEELKLILRNLEDSDKSQLANIFSSKQNRQQQIKQHEPTNRPYRILPSKSNTIQSIYKRNNILRVDKALSRTKQQQNDLNMMERSGDQVLHYLLRKNNYSANELNIKALKILHAIRLNKPRCDTSLKQDKSMKLYSNSEHRKSILAFVKRAR